MFFKASCFIGFALVTACGGSSFGGGGGSDSGSGGRAGSTGSGGSLGKSGSTSGGGSVGATGGGGADCRTVRCAAPVCTQGELVTPPGECCPSCSCARIDCAYPVCPSGAEPVVEPGDCCPTCPAEVPSCKGVECATEIACPVGYAHQRPTGACCAGCMPENGAVGCLPQPCEELRCPPGYVSGELAGACCSDCVPDPLYCAADQDCLMADRPRACCGCFEPVSTRMYDEDACWSAASDPRAPPKECYPQFMCGAICAPCAAPGVAKCVNQRCSELR